MKRRDVLLMLLLATLLGAGTEWVPPVHAVGVVSFGLDASNTSQTDTVVSVSASEPKSFRIGVVANATITSPVQRVYGWQFTIGYNSTAFVPQGDPNPLATPDNQYGLYPDGAVNTVLFGAQTAFGTVNWAGLISANNAFGSYKVNSTAGRVVVFFSILNPNPPVSMSSRTLMASVGFELVNKPSSAQLFTISNVTLVDDIDAPISGVTAGRGWLETVTNNPPHADFSYSSTPQIGPYALAFNATTSYDSDGNIPVQGGYFWDYGDGTQDYGLTGPVVSHNYTSPGPYNATLRVQDNLGATGSSRNSLGGVNVNSQPSHIVIDPMGDGPGYFSPENGAGGCLSVSNAKFAASSSSLFNSLVSTGAYTYSRYGIGTDGAICRIVLFFTSPSGAVLEVVANPDGTLMDIFRQSAPVASLSEHLNTWSGYEAQCISCDGASNNQIQGAYMTFTVPSSYNPTSGAALLGPGELECCVMAEWVGVGDQHAAGDNLLIQAGIFKGTNSWARYDNQLIVEIVYPNPRINYTYIISSPCRGGIRDGDMVDVEVSLSYNSRLDVTNTDFVFYDRDSTGVSLKCKYEDNVQGQALPGRVSTDWAYFIVESPESTGNVANTPRCNGTLKDHGQNMCEFTAWEPSIQESGYMLTNCCGTQPINFAGVSTTQLVSNQCIDVDPNFVNVQPSSLTDGYRWSSFWVTSVRESESSVNQCLPDFTVVPYPSPLVFLSPASEYQSTVYLNSVDGYSGNLSFALTPSSSGLSASCQNYFLASRSVGSQVDCRFNSSTPGAYTLNLTATDGSITHWAIMTVEVMQSGLLYQSYFNNGIYGTYGLFEFGMFWVQSNGTMIGAIKSSVSNHHGTVIWSENK